MIHFGTGGWRAVIGEDFTRDNLEKLALAIALKMKDEGLANCELVIGYDSRFLSKEAQYWMAVVFAENGIRVKFIRHSVPTPVVMYYVKEHRLRYGLMVTASHNPAIYNGVKVFIAGGRDADVSVTREIERYFIRAEEIYCRNENENCRMPPAAYDSLKRAGMIEEIDPLDEYIDSILRDIDVDAIKRRKPRVSIDPMYGVSLQSLNTILTVARCEINAIHTEHDTLFGGHMPAPNDRTIRSLQSHVLEKGSAIGIATDGDADRLGVVDDKGHFLHANDILVMVYYYQLKYKGLRGPAVRNVATTHRLDRLAEKYGQRCFEVPVGFKNISAKMLETSAIIGGESSGGIAVQGRTNGKDGIFAASLLVEIVAATNLSLSELSQRIDKELGSTYMEERDYRFSSQERSALKKILFEERKVPDLPFPIDHVSYIDGCKLYFQNGSWMIARFSGTEPLLRIFCEMENRDDAILATDIMEKMLNLDRQ